MLMNLQSGAMKSSKAVAMERTSNRAKINNIAYDSFMQDVYFIECCTQSMASF